MPLADAIDFYTKANGYDLDVVKYRTLKTAAGGAPMNPTTYPTLSGNTATNILVPAADRFTGYSMGPGYWGKTFFMWPPDPRFDPTANVLSPDAARPGFDTAGKEMCDWRRRFFFNKSGTALDPQGDNNTTNTAGTVDGVNEAVLNTGASGHTLALAANQVNYAAVLKWIKSGPQVLPPNLRAGRVLYYSSIPDDVNTATGTAQQQLDKGFWKQYIDFVLSTGSHSGVTGGQSPDLYGSADSWGSSLLLCTTHFLWWVEGWSLCCCLACWRSL